jgi:hypothetical protein
MARSRWLPEAPQHQLQQQRLQLLLRRVGRQQQHRAQPHELFPHRELVRRRILDRPPKAQHGTDLICDAQPFGRLWYARPNAASNAVDYAKFYSRSHDAAIRVYGCGWHPDQNARA